MNDPITARICILYLTSTPDHEQAIRLEFEKSGLQVELQRAENEAQFRLALEKSPDLILSQDTLANFSTLRALQLAREQIKNIPFLLLMQDANEDLALEAIQRGAAGSLTKSQLGRLGLTVQQLLEQRSVRASEERYHSIFDNMTVAMLEEDFTQLHTELEQLRAQGVTDLPKYIQEHPDSIDRGLRLIRVLDVNKAMLGLFDAEKKEDLLGSLDKFVSPKNFEAEWLAFAEGKSHFEREITSQTLTGKPIDLLLSVTFHHDHANEYRARVILTDITARKKAETELRNQNEFLELLNEMTRTILLANNYESTMRMLAGSLKTIIHADDCYILRWDADKKRPIPVVTTALLDFPFSQDAIREEELRVATWILNLGQVVAIDDVYNSPHLRSEIANRFPATSILGIPLIARGQKLGVAIIAFHAHHSFTQEEMKRAEQSGNQVALAILEFQQRLEIQRQLTESNALMEISRALSEHERVGTGEVLQLIVDSSRELMPRAERSVIHLLDMQEQTLFAHAVSGFDAEERQYKGVRMRLGEGIAGQVMSEGVTINIGDILSHPDFLPAPSTPNYRSLLVTPVQSGSHRIGTISILSNSPHAFTGNDEQLLKSLAIQAAVALENTRLFESTQQSLKEVNILYQISSRLAQSLDAEQLIRDVIGFLQQIFEYHYVQIFVTDPETQNLVTKHGSGYIGTELVQGGHYLPAGEGIVGHVAQTGEPFVTNNVEEVVFFKRNPLLPTVQYEIAVPIKIDQQVIGVLDIQQIPPHRFTDNDLQLMIAIADHLAVVLQKANLYSTLQTTLQQEQMVRSQLIQSERLALVGRLLASVSHELNNPLQAIQNALFLLKEEKNLSLQARQDLDVILSEAERMAALIERLRSAYRPIRMKDFRAVDLNDLIEDVHMLISTHMRHKNIVFEFHPDLDLAAVSGLPDQMRQVVLNLFLNAIEIMQPGGRLMVTTRNQPAEGEVLLTVKDTGPGIDSEILPQIFDAFITSKHTGTGLGLTITHDIIQQHHGRISAENDPEGGAVFTVWLPIDERGQS